MNENEQKKAAHQPSASISIIIFAFVLGATAVWWTLATGKGGGPFAKVRHVFGGGPAKVEEIAETLPVYRRSLDGMPISAPEEGADLVAVAIDNFTTARPQSGVAHAPLVIEAPVEAGITRLLAIFYADHGLERIGPIRSARPYFVDWAEEYDAMYVHVGGSDAALARLRTESVRNIDEFGAGAYFWRDRGRDAPHNAYTSAELLAAAERKRFDNEISRPLASWSYKDETPAAERPAEEVLGIHYQNDEYAVEWRYLPDENVYERWQDGDQVFDEDGTPVRAKDVIVQYMKVRVIDAVGRREIDTQGTGDLLAALDGTVVNGTWSRKGDGRTELLNADGDPLLLNAGTAWVEVVPEGTEITY